MAAQVLDGGPTITDNSVGSTTVTVMQSREKCLRIPYPVLNMLIVNSMGPYRSPLSRVVVVVVVVDHKLWTSILLCLSPGVTTVARRLRCSYS